MKPTYNFVLLIICFSLNYKSQVPLNDSAKKFLRKYYDKNQKELDKNTSGIGIEISSLQYGKNYRPVDFKKINIRAKRFEFLVGVGDCYYYSPQSEKTYNVQVNYWAIGFNQPISALGIGHANSTSGIRLLPFIGMDFGHSNFRVPISNEKAASAFHLTAAPGYRIKIPYLIIDFRLNTTMNFLIKENYHPGLTVLNASGDIVKENGFRRFNITPSVSIIIDGLFSKFNPKDTKVSGTTVMYDKVSTKDYYSGETRNESTGKTEKTGLYKRETTYEYHTEAVELPVSDIGAFIGIGPRLLFKPVSKNSYRMPTLMGGFGVHGRVSLLSFDINADKGVIGTSAQVKSDHKILKSDTLGKGTFNATNLTANLGIDLGPLMMALLGTVTKRNGETPYFSFNGGIILGYSFLNDYKYHYDGVAQSYHNYFLANPDKQTANNDATLNKSGTISGWYIGAEVGAVGFRYEFNKYTNAPLARCAYYAISYKFPLTKSKHKN